MGGNKGSSEALAGALELLRSHPVERLVRNALADCTILPLEGTEYPVLIPGTGGSQSNVSSFHTHYVRYPEWEWRRMGVRRRWYRLGLVAFRVLAALLPSEFLDRIVYCDNCLLTTNPVREWTPPALAAMTSRLVETYPERAVVVRSVNDARPELKTLFQHSGYRLVRSRRIFILDPSDPETRKSHDVQLDLRLLQDLSPHRVSLPLEPGDSERMAGLYNALYRERYPAYNPEYTADFFQTAAQCRLIRFEGFRVDGRLEAFVGIMESQQELTGLMLGVEENSPRRFLFYRACFGIVLDAALKSGCVLNLSAGAEQFKLNRHARRLLEYDAVFYRHLGWVDRLRWSLLRTAYQTAEELGLDQLKKGTQGSGQNPPTRSSGKALPGGPDVRRKRLVLPEPPLRILYLGTDHHPTSVEALKGLLQVQGCVLSTGLCFPFDQPVSKALLRTLDRDGLAGVANLMAKVLVGLLRRVLMVLGWSPSTSRTVLELLHTRNVAWFPANAVNSAAVVERIREFMPDLIVICGFSRILSESVFRIPRLGCINVHTPLLPRYCGSDPDFWVLRNQEKVTGVTVHYVDGRIDSGDIILQQSLELDPGDSEEVVRSRLNRMAAGLLRTCVERLVAGRPLNRRPQIAAKATYAGMPSQRRSTEPAP